MATLNVHGHAHGSKSETYTGGRVIHYKSFPQNHHALPKIRNAMRIMDELARLPATDQCNLYFKGLALGQTLTQLWLHGGIFINHSPDNPSPYTADTHSNNVDIAFHEAALLTSNHWVLAATLCHELAHCGGAPAGTHDAERAVHECRFGPDHYNPGFLGFNESAHRPRKFVVA
ncbi:hypothetical protein FHY55_15660 [Oceanicola sp. D3]|uniref:hypothetical protein n=1 Tax=Oceanicola sp. D3 TaxID=2587163 RepID=UPI00112006FA|nr:hypothetical protein [Oceanicola sp. D3]QDC10585.1 hypothetical protein FHY55_15660 [Oceanicola sp. D3]